MGKTDLLADHAIMHPGVGSCIQAFTLFGEAFFRLCTNKLAIIFASLGFSRLVLACIDRAKNRNGTVIRPLRPFLIQSNLSVENGL